MSVQVARRGAVAANRRKTSAPAAAAAAGFTTLNFLDDFTSTSTIDYAGTASAGAGYKWTSKNPFVNETPVCNSSNTTISGSVLTLNQAADNLNIGLCTTNRGTSSHLAGPWLHGYFEASIKFDAAAVALPASGGWPSFWSMGATHCLLTNGTRWPEIDFFEFAKDTGKASGGVYAHSIHDHDKHTGTETDRWNGGVNTTDVNPATWNTFHTYGCLWQTQSVKWYFDNTLINTQTWTSTTQTPTGTNANSGTYVITDDATDGPAAMFLGTGSAAAMLVDWVKVWQ